MYVIRSHMFEIRRSDWLNSMSTSHDATEPRAFLPTIHSAHELYPAIMADNNDFGSQLSHTVSFLAVPADGF